MSNETPVDDDAFDREDNYKIPEEFKPEVAPTAMPGEDPRSAGPAIGAFQEPVYEDEGEGDNEYVDQPRTLFVPDQKPVNFTIERNHSGKPLEDQEPTMAFIRERSSTVQKVLEAFDKSLSEAENGELVGSEVQAWLAAIVQGMRGIDMSEAPVGATEREGSEWTQGIQVPGYAKLMRPGQPAQRIDRNKKISVETQLAYLAAQSGEGTTYETFLPDSGIWLRLQSPSLQQVTAMQEEMQAVRLRMGAESKGMTYSNSMNVIMNAVTTMALTCVIGSNRQYNTPADLEHELSVYDELVLHHALAATMYPEGFNYAVPCVADPEVCSSVIKFKLNMSNVVWYDNSVFTPEQRAFIARRFQLGSDEDFANYRKQFVNRDSSVVWIGKIGLRFAPPTIEKRRQSGDAWMASIIEMSQGAYNEPPHGQQRQKYIEKLMNSSKAQQFAPWVNAIYIEDGIETDEVRTLEDKLFSEDEAVITGHLASHMSSPKLIDKFYDLIKDFNNSRVNALVALPSHNCEVCNTPQATAFKERFPHLVPLDMLTVVFTLVARKVAHLG